MAVMILSSAVIVNSALYPKKDSVLLLLPTRASGSLSERCPFWSMNYAGRVIGENFSGDFLKDALLHVPETQPYRGPQEYADGDYVYRCETDGDFDWFQGRETISHQGIKIYECVFHGGMIR